MVDKMLDYKYIMRLIVIKVYFYQINKGHDVTPLVMTSHTVSSLTCTCYHDEGEVRPYTGTWPGLSDTRYQTACPS